MFDPWIGPQFGEPANKIGGLGLLIVGESHYPGPHADNLIGECYVNHIKETIERDAIEKLYAFFKAIARLISGEDPSLRTRTENTAFWNSVAFYTFIPHFIAPPQKRKRPKMAEWKAGQKHFFDAFKIIDPTTVLVCGLDLWWWVMDLLPGGEACNSSKRDFACIWSASALRIPHSSSRGTGRYAYETARPMFEKLTL